jgi:two-component system sensor histidine kinase KdpD
MTTRIRRQEMVAREREKRTHALFLLSRGLSGASGMEEVTKAATEAIQKYFSFDPCFILQDGNHKLEVNNCKPGLKRLTQEEIQVAQWVYAHSREAGALTANPFAVESTFFPLTGTRINPGVVMFRQSKTMGHEQKSFWYTFIAQVSNAMEREFLGELAQKVRFLDESDRLYKTLFNSISHELRIPVATIMGASDSILHSGNSKNVQSALCREIFTASVRLNRLIENLLNMSRI